MSVKRRFKEIDNSSSSSTPTCLCGLDAVQRICQKPGSNHGRSFWTCVSHSCRFFRSSDGKPWNSSVAPVSTEPTVDSHSDSDEQDIVSISPPPPRKRQRGNTLELDPEPFIANIVSGSARSLELTNKLEMVIKEESEVMAKLNDWFKKLEELLAKKTN